jgi:hypothetical protein
MFFIIVFWDGGTTERNSFSMVKDAVCCEARKERTGIPHVLLACHL